MKKVKITVEDSMTGESWPMEFECDDFQISEEMGHQKIFDPTSRRFGPDIRSNGQYRLTLKAWKGCPDFDSFVSSEEVQRVAGQTLVVKQKTDKGVDTFVQPPIPVNFLETEILDDGSVHGDE